jgi:hypothetical protein
MPIFRLSALPRFGKGLKVFSDRLQTVRKLLHQRVLHIRRNPLPTGPSKPFGNAVILHQLFYLTYCDSCWLRKLWLQLKLRECNSDIPCKFASLFRAEIFATVTSTSASDLSLCYSNLGTTLAPFYSETWMHSVLSFATLNLKFGHYISPLFSSKPGRAAPQFRITPLPITYK